MINYQQLQSKYIQNIQRYSKKIQNSMKNSYHDINQLIKLLNSPFYSFLFRNIIVNTSNELHQKINNNIKELECLSLNISNNI